jgi:transposase
VTDAPPPEDPRDALIREQAAQIAVLEAVVADLRERLEAAERAGSRNSGNSSMPPADAADLGVARSYQQEEVPAAAAERVQHDLHRAGCACGRTHVAPRPAGVPDSALSIGPRLRALAVYLVVFQHVPVERCRQLIADVAGAAVSDGFIHSCLAKAASLAADVVALIRALITASAVAGFDETTLRSGPAGEKKYVHGAFTELYSAFWLGARSLEAMQEAGGILPEFGGIVVSDRYQNSSTPGGSMLPGTSRAWLTSCATTRTALRATRARSGRCRRSGRCAA